jgi:hypothetical protein
MKQTTFNQDEQCPDGFVIGRQETEGGGHEDVIYKRKD